VPPLLFSDRRFGMTIAIVQVGLTSTVYVEIRVTTRDCVSNTTRVAFLNGDPLGCVICAQCFHFSKWGEEGTSGWQTTSQAIDWTRHTHPISNCSIVGSQIAGFRDCNKQRI
jgi:hypothetical protein